MESIYITGAGVVSAIGIGKSETLVSLRKEESGIRQMRYLPSIHRDLPVGEVQLSNEEMMQMLGVSQNLFLTRTALIGRMALREALEQAGLAGDKLNEVPFISATTVGGMDRRELYYGKEREFNSGYAYALLSTHNCADCTEMIADYFGKFAFLSTVSTACSSATNALITGANMLRCGMAEMVVVGGAE
ncbi:MAG: beta-ketoacyl-[Prevotella sp.]|nr:beta-ketoacyl-[acyl-carrier-protein] synthase family protein [Prevotella sp.]